MKNNLNKIKNFWHDQSGSVYRTIIYTIGHIFIAASCVMFFTGANIYESLTDAIIEPILNGFWYYLLDRFWVNKKTLFNN